MSPKVYIVGAGPGDPELLTLKALRLLQNAEVLVYDRLINPAILDYCSKQVVRIFVGKEDGKHTLSQEKINELLAFHALAGRKVVRLKGGDPFVFGRGGEEALFLKNRKIDFEIVPAVSSSIAAPAYAGIPVSHRGLASSFTIVTGHQSPEKSSGTLNWKSLAEAETLVFLMGVSKKAEIAKRLIAEGRSSHTEVAFVQNACTTYQKSYFTQLGLISKNYPAVKSPAVMIVGRVCQLGPQLSWFEKSLSIDENHPSSELRNQFPKLNL